MQEERSITMKKPILMLTFGVLLSFLAGCMGYGKLRDVPYEEKAITIDVLRANWRDYNIYWTGLDVNDPSGIMFDPKGDSRSLTSDNWRKLEDDKNLLNMIEWLQVNRDYPPYLLEIIGPDNQIYGYMYTGWRQGVIKRVDDRTLWVGDLPWRLQRDNSRFEIRDNRPMK